jgi:hypothetical protein
MAAAPIMSAGRFSPWRVAALRLFLVCKTESEPYHEAHHRKCGNKNDQKSSGVENHGATFFNARTMRPFKLFA